MNESINKEFDNMIQDIGPHQFHNETIQCDIKAEDYVLLFHENEVLLHLNDTALEVPTVRMMKEIIHNEIESNLVYLFSIDEIGFFWLKQEIEVNDISFIYKNIQVFRSLQPGWMAFGGITGSQLYRWYTSHNYCGRCGNKMQASDKERAMVCPECGLTDYPKISPAVIVGIVDGERILMTKYADRDYKRYALIAGFMEIGETLEDTVKREVMEEVGLKVKNIRYYKNQPWAFSDSLLVGFFAELDGDEDVTLDYEELSEAVWMKREEIPENPSKISLTNEMIETFIAGNHL